MRRDHFVVDIRRNRGDSRLVIDLVRRFCSGFPGATVEWLVRPDQAHLLPSDHILGQGGQFDVSWTARIRDRLIQLAQSDMTGGSLWVLSYDNMMLSEAQNLRLANFNVSYKHLSELIKGASVARPRFESAWVPLGMTNAVSGDSRTLSPTEASALAKEVLRRGQHRSPETALAQKDLRPQMGAIDGRAMKRVGDPASETLITNIVDAGLQEAWLRRFRRVPDKTGTEALYLVEVEMQSAPPVEAANVLPPAPYFITPVVADSSTAVAERGQTTSIVREQEPLAAEVNLARRKFPNRATAFEALLQKARFGSLPETRELFFNVIEQILGERSGNSPLLAELFAEAGKRAQAKAAEDGYASEKNWTVAKRCIQRLMLWAGVLVGEKGPIEDKIGFNSTPRYRTCTRLPTRLRRIRGDVHHPGTERHQLRRRSLLSRPDSLSARTAEPRAIGRSQGSGGHAADIFGGREDHRDEFRPADRSIRSKATFSNDDSRGWRVKPYGFDGPLCCTTSLTVR